MQIAHISFKCVIKDQLQIIFPSQCTIHREKFYMSNQGSVVQHLFVVYIQFHEENF